MGHLPTRPNSGTYADHFVDERPAERPDTELPAAVFNNVMDDLAWCARMTSLLKIRIANNGVSATVVEVSGPEGVQTSDVVATRTGAGEVTVNWTATGISATDALPGSCRHVTLFAAPMTRNLTPSSIEIYFAGNTGPSGVDTDFTLWVY